MYHLEIGSSLFNHFTLLISAIKPGRFLSVKDMYRIYLMDFLGHKRLGKETTQYENENLTEFRYTS